MGWGVVPRMAPPPSQGGSTPYPKVLNSHKFYETRQNLNSVYDLLVFGIDVAILTHRMITH